MEALKPVLFTMDGPPIAKIGETIRVKGRSGLFKVLNISATTELETHYSVLPLGGNRKQRRVKASKERHATVKGT